MMFNPAQQNKVFEWAIKYFSYIIFQFVIAIEWMQTRTFCFL